MSKKIPNHPLVPLSDEQIRILMLSDEDIKNGRLVSHEQVDKEDREFLRSITAENEIEQKT
jgi:hypothetical protein